MILLVKLQLLFPQVSKLINWDDNLDGECIPYTIEELKIIHKNSKQCIISNLTNHKNRRMPYKIVFSNGDIYKYIMATCKDVCNPVLNFAIFHSTYERQI